MNKLPLVKALHLLLGVLLCTAPLPIRAAGALLREEGAIYLEDLLPRPVKLATVQDAPIFWKIDLGKYLGTLRKGQLVEIQAVGDGAYRVRGQAQQGQVLGWVEPKYLSPLKPEFLANLKQNAARKAEVDALIARNEVAINMSPEEVGKSLGKPARKTSRLDANGREEVWEFDGERRAIFFFELDDETIWGATARVLHQLLRVALGIDSPEPPAP